MQTVILKYDIISWVTALQDLEMIKKLHNLTEKPSELENFTEGIVVSPRRKGSLTEGYGFWAENPPLDETNYRNNLWQTEKNAW